MWQQPEELSSTFATLQFFCSSPLSVTQVVLEAEVSRDMVPLRNAYKHIGQKARVRINGGVEYTLPSESTHLSGQAAPKGGALGADNS